MPDKVELPHMSDYRVDPAATRTALLELFDHAIEIGIAGAKATCEPVPTSLGNPLAVRDHLELTGLTRRNDGFNA